MRDPAPPPGSRRLSARTSLRYDAAMRLLWTLARFFFCAVAVFIAANAAHARDLPKSDPERLPILDAARGSEKIKFVVKDLYKAGDYAFLCAMKQGNDGRVYRTDEAYDVYHYLFVKEPTGWVALSSEGGFAKNPRDVDCAPGRTGGGTPRAVDSQEDIQRLLVATVEERVRQGLHFGKVDEREEILLRILVGRNIPLRIRIDGEKQTIDETDANHAAKQCPTESCREASREAFQHLKSRQTDATVSPLVWNACQFGRRRHDLSVIDRCVSTLAPKRRCRPGMDYLADRADIEACVGEIRALCRSTMDKDCAL